MKCETDNNLYNGFYIINSQNYTDRQLEYLYFPIDDVKEPKVKELNKLLDKAEKNNDYRTYYFIIDKWAGFVLNGKI